MRRIGDIFETITLVFSGAITILMVGLVVLAVLMRYVFNAPLVFSYDLSVILFAWVVFASLGLAERFGAHLSVDIIDQVLPRAIAATLAKIRQFLLAALSLWFAYLGWKLLMRSGMDIPSLRISIRWLYAAFPVGFVLLGLAQILNMIVPRVEADEMADA